MSETDRRAFIKALGAAAAGSVLPASIGRALAIPANNVTGTIMDVEHVIILMQENRSFDHYFGTMRGVRGFNDPRTVTLSTGKSAWYQPTGAGSDYVLPFHPTTPVTGTTNAPDLGITFLEDLDHSWTKTHYAWNNGQWDQWVPNKTATTMAYLTRDDIPYHYALADAFTICDGYHCSILGPTDPNRYFMWTGWVGNDGKGGGPVVDNAEKGYNWSTYPERLEKAGVTWKIYQDVGNGLHAAGYWGWTSNPYIGNYGDNSLLYFWKYQHAAPGSPLFEAAKTGTNIAAGGDMFQKFAKDVASGNLPQVSWIVAPEAYCEHPNWIPNWGAWYISRMLDILTARPDIWAKTALFLTYDENDGFFDHVVPPTPPMSDAQGLSTVGTANEIFAGTESPNIPADTESVLPPGPYGLGVRVPMIVISPWSKGGYVNSQVFDHTSLIRFLEQRFANGNPALIETNITKWRRTVSGDLTSCFNFASPNAVTLPALPADAAFAPPTGAEILAGTRYTDYVPAVPTAQTMARQEPGIRPARALPYRPIVHGLADQSAKTVTLSFANRGTVGMAYQVRSGNGATGPWSFTIGHGHTASHAWDFANAATSGYDLSVFGPNGFFRRFAGSVASGAANLNVQATDVPSTGDIRMTIANIAAAVAEVKIRNVYDGQTETHVLAGGESFSNVWDLSATHGWYDLIVTVVADTMFQQHLAGHVETGADSFTDPAMGAA